MSVVTVDSLPRRAEESKEPTQDPSELDYNMKLLEKNEEERKAKEKKRDIPSTSERIDSPPPPLPPAEVVVIREDDNPGRFLFIWLFGFRFPSLCVDGEPKIPVELIRKRVETPDFARDFEEVFRKKGACIRVCTPRQLNILHQKCEECRSHSTITLVSRSDVDRIMGEIREESVPTNCENDNWNTVDRIRVVHTNFADYCSSWFENADLDEDATNAGTHGYWYKNRDNMRCIECLECKRKFNPADFVAHHHNPVIHEGIIHIGLNVNNWSKLIDVHISDQTEENLEAWNMFVRRSHRVGKRAYDEAAPQQPKKRALEKTVVESIIEQIVEDEKQEENDEDPEKMEIQEEKETEIMIDVFGPSGSKDTINAYYEKLKQRALEKMDEETFDSLLFNSTDDILSMKKERDFIKKVMRQQKNWQRIREHPKFKCIATANFDSKRGTFVNMSQFDGAPKLTKLEIQKLAESFEKLAKNQELSSLDHIKQEIELLKTVSTDAIRVLDNRPLPPAPPPPPQPKQIVKPKAIQPVPTKPVSLPPLPISFANMNYAQIAQHLLASGIKIPLPPQVPIPQVTLPKIPMIIPQIPVTQTSPIVSPAASSTPESPVLPIPPVFPIINPEILKAQLQMALSTPALLPIFCQSAIKMPSFEQISQYLKAQTVKN